MYAVDERQRVDIPWEAGAWVEVRALTGPEKDEADWKGTEIAQAQMREISPALITPIFEAQERADRERAERRRLAEAAGEAVASGDEERTTGYGAFDPGTLCKYAIVAWSLADKPAPENIEKLSAKVRDFVAVFVYGMNVRPEGEENDSGGSLARPAGSPTNSGGPTES